MSIKPSKNLRCNSALRANFAKFSDMVRAGWVSSCPSYPTSTTGFNPGGSTLTGTAAIFL